MFTPESNESELNEAIKRLLEEMAAVECDSDEYAKMADQVTKLIKAKEIEVNLLLKSIELDQKDTVAQATLRQKEIEISQRYEEVNALHELKLTEISHRREEAESNRVLKESEIDLKQQELEIRKRVSPETWATIAANVAGIVLILGHERVNVVTSKALGFIPKLFR